ncbi:hypothetical protein Lacidipiscis_01609 [Ligilactobacillus acidipiscis]|nr:hypothetical protein Lacidipiscis_01609 [Ligilactobacillus acidipiscis]
MFSVVTKYHKGRHSLFLYNSEIFYAFTQDILRSPQVFPALYILNLFFSSCTFLPPNIMQFQIIFTPTKLSLPIISV